MISARLIAVTKPWEDATASSSSEEIISYCARVSNPSNQEKFDTSEKLLRYCIRNKHWSVFEMAAAIVEVKAPRDITRQLLRHRSFSFQEFSQRYSNEIEFCDREVRLQDHKNRQNSFETDDEGLEWFWKDASEWVTEASKDAYEQAIENGIAKEVARVVLPEGLTMSTLYMSGTLRSYIHYLEVREGNGTQKEHIQLAKAIREAITPAFPVVMQMVTND